MPYRSLRYRSPRRAKSGTAPNLNTPTVAGVGKVGNQLTATFQGYANVPVPTPVVTYQWQQSDDGATGWVNVPVGQSDGNGPTTANYTIGSNQYGKYLRCLVTATNSVGVDAKPTATVGPVAGIAPVQNTPTIQGTVREGNTVSCNVNYADPQPVPVPAVTYQWQYSTDNVTGWTNISGATSIAYLLDATYIGYYLRCLTVATNPVATSNGTSNGSRIDSLYFGDGFDGDASLTGTITVSGNKRYRNLTISSSAIVRVTGLIQVCRTLSGADGGSILHADGFPGVTGTSNSDGSAMVGPAGGAGGTLGGAGGDGGAYNGGGQPGQPGQAGNGLPSPGVGGTSSNNRAGGAGPWTASGPTSKSQIRDNSGGWGGGGGGGGTDGATVTVKTTSYNTGNSGGGAGGFLRVLANIISGTGKFRSNGAAASQAGAAGDGGGGRVAVGTYSANLAAWLSEAIGTIGARGGTAVGVSQNGVTHEDFGAGD